MQDVMHFPSCNRTSFMEPINCGRGFAVFDLVPRIPAHTLPAMPLVKKRAKDTLTAVELDRGETLRFKLRSGETWTMELLETSAEVFRTTLKQLKVQERLARTDFRFRCGLKINGRPYKLERECSTQKSFYEP